MENASNISLIYVTQKLQDKHNLSQTIRKGKTFESEK